MRGRQRILKLICGFILVQIILAAIVPVVGLQPAMADDGPGVVVPPVHSTSPPTDTTVVDTLSSQGTVIVSDPSLIGGVLMLSWGLI